MYLYEPKVINQLWRPPPLEHSKALQHVYIYIYMYISIMIYWREKNYILIGYHVDWAQTEE